MEELLVGVIVLNLLLFAGFAVWAFRYARRADSPRMRLLADALAVVSVAFVLGAVTRLAAVAVAHGWLPGRAGEFLTSEWHLMQSLASTALAVAGFLVVRRLSTPIRAADRLASVVSDRLLEAGGLENAGLTNREMDVLRAIAQGHISDQQIADVLFISPSTAGTHVKNILRKTGIRSRRELALMAASSEI